MQNWFDKIAGLTRTVLNNLVAQELLVALGHPAGRGQVFYEAIQ